MFCPSCGSEERQASQFCRACGVDLRAVRLSLERPDSITASAVSARDEIGRAVADKIRSVSDAGELKVVADSVLPQVEKFLESPEEKRLRRLRAGVITALIGLGTALSMFALAEVPNLNDDLFVLYLILGLGVAAFASGLGLILNGLFLTRPRKTIADRSEDAQLQQIVDSGYAPPTITSDARLPLRAQTTSNLSDASAASVTEHTTEHLKSKR